MRPRVNTLMGLQSPLDSIDSGIRIIEDASLYDTVEDWSRVRSPSRASRRLRQGHRQNIRHVQQPKRYAMSIDGGKTLIVHPNIANELRRELKHSVEAAVESATQSGYDAQRAVNELIVPPPSMGLTVRDLEDAIASGAVDGARRAAWVRDAAIWFGVQPMPLTAFRGLAPLISWDLAAA